MNPRVSLLFFLLLVAAMLAAGCTATMGGRQKTYVCPSCKQVIPANATVCPNCGQRLMPVGATAQPSAAGTPPAVAQAPKEEKKKFPPVKVGALLEMTDGNHQRIAPFVSVEVFNYKLERQNVTLFLDAGVAEDAIFGSVGVREILPDAPYVGGFFFMMFDFRRTLNTKLLGAHQPHFCVGVGVTLGGF